MKLELWRAHTPRAASMETACIEIESEHAQLIESLARAKQVGVVKVGVVELNARFVALVKNV